MGVKGGGYQTRLTHLRSEDFQDTGYQGLAGDQELRSLPFAVMPTSFSFTSLEKGDEEDDEAALSLTLLPQSQLKHHVFSLSPDYPT